MSSVTIHQPGDPVYQPLPAEAQTALLTDLARIDMLRRRYDVAVLTPPAEGSAAKEDMADRLRAYGYDQAAAAMAAALDHLTAWWRLLEAGVMPTYAHMTLLRTAHESALLAYWLFDPAIDRNLRLARGVAARRRTMKSGASTKRRLDSPLRRGQRKRSLLRSDCRI